MSEESKQRPLHDRAVQGPERLGAPSVRLFLVRLRPRRAELRFAERQHIIGGIRICESRLTSSEVAINQLEHDTRDQL